MATPVLEPVVHGSESLGGGRWMTLIHNNDTNSVDEVVMILMIATGCDVDEAYTETWEAHHFGKAACHFGEKGECQEVADIVSRIGLRTDVIPEWGED